MAALAALLDQNPSLAEELGPAILQGTKKVKEGKATPTENPLEDQDGLCHTMTSLARRMLRRLAPQTRKHLVSQACFRLTETLEVGIINTGHRLHVRR